MTPSSVDAPAIAWLVGTILFLIGCWIGATYRTVRPRKPIGRRYVQERRDIIGGRRG